MGFKYCPIWNCFARSDSSAEVILSKRLAQEEPQSLKSGSAPARQQWKKELMKTRKNEMNDDLRPEYDLGQLLKGGVRGKYAKRYHAGTNLVLLDPDVHKAFRSGRAVNDALRLVIELRKG